MEIIYFVQRFERWYCSICMALLLLLFKWVFEKQILKYIKKCVKDTDNTYDDFAVFALEPPVCLALYVSVFYVAVINAPIDIINYMQWPTKILRTVLLFCVFWGLYRLFLPKNSLTNDMGIVHKFMDDIVEKNDTAYANMVSVGARILVCVAAFGVFCSELGYDLSAFIASLSIGTAAILYASKDAFSNVISSIIILLDKPFEENEWIKTNNIEGVVQEISFRSTKIRTFANEEVYIPSSLLVNAPIINVSRCGKRRIKSELALSLDTPRENIESVLREIRDYLNTNNNLTHEKDDVRVYFTEFHYVCYKIEIVCFMVGTDQITYLNNCNEIDLELVKILERNKVKLAFQNPSDRNMDPVDMLDFCDDVVR